LRAKLLIGTLLMLVPILALLLAAFNSSYDRRREIVLESLLQIARGAAALVDATFDEAIILGQAIASDPAIQSLDPALVTPRLRRLGTSYDQYETFFVFDGAGELRGVSDADVPTSLNIADRPYFQQVMQTGQAASFGLVVGRRTGAVSTGVAVPIYRDQGTGGPVGVLVVSFDLDRLQARITSMGLYGSQVVALFDPSGRLALQASEPPLTTNRDWDQRDFSAVLEIQAALAG
jgi:C4-dicarboxylate-specific signal transduction histidine kinase